MTETFSLHVLETDTYYDVTFNSWAQGNGSGSGAGGGFSYTRVEVDGPGELELSNFNHIDLYTTDVYEAGGEPGVGDFDIDGPGLVITAEFAASTGNNEPYVGSVGIFWDANFNGVLDESDINVLDGNEDNHGSVMLLFDNSPNDIDSEIGKYAAYLDDLEFLTTQGATFIFAAMNVDGTVLEEHTVSPFNASTIRFSGTAMLSGSDSDPVHGMFINMSKIVYETYYDDYYNDYVGNYNYYPVALGVTGPDGTYDIGSVDILLKILCNYLHQVLQEGLKFFDHNRLFPLVESADGEYGVFTEFSVYDGINETIYLFLN